MSEIKWIKITTTIFDDEAIKIIEQMPEGDALIVIWLKLLIRAGIINDGGLVYLKENLPYTDETLSIVFNRPVTLIRLALATFEKFGMIEILDSNAILISNWEKHQNFERLDKIRESTRKRVQKFRENKKKNENLLSCNVTVTEDVTQCNAVEEDKDIDIDIDKEEEYISISSNIVEAPKNFLTEEEIDFLTQYVIKEHNAKNPIRYVNKLIENGDYKQILVANKLKQAIPEPHTSRAECRIYKPEKVEITKEDEEASKLIMQQIRAKKFRRE